MNRIIKFRGKGYYTGKWMYGSIKAPCPGLENYPHFNDYYMWETGGEKVKVETKTIGQYTGLKDRNGKEIYEGDIFQFGYNETRFTAIVGWNNEVGAWCIRFNYETIFGTRPLGEWLKECLIEIIGNIHDNPELINAKMKNI